MDADSYKKLKDIFQSVVEIPPDERPAYLNEKCDGDHELRAEVERLLDSYDSGYLEDPLFHGQPTISSHELPEGYSIAHYTIVRKIGSGGMGEVYLADDGKLGRRVAIKRLPETFTEDEDRLLRFEQEARNASALNHPNILTIHEIGETGNTRYIATEYIEGETLRARLNRGRFPVNEALEIAIQCASALAAAHELGIIHRDIKPENIMLRRDGLVKLLDFGLAKLAAAPTVGGGPAISHDALTERHVRTAPGVIMGTVQYMSPEQTRGHVTDASTDIWSLGVVIYEMVAGTPPFEGDNTADLIAEIVKTSPIPISQNAAAIPERLDEIVAKSIEKNPHIRYGTVKDMLGDLQSLNRRLDFDSELARLGTPIKGLETQTTKKNGDRAGAVHRPVVVSGRHLKLIGREAEIAEIKDLLRADDIHLLTLTGVGGTGKTTLAKAIADEMLADFEGSICFVELASVTDPNLVVSAIAKALELEETGSKPILEILKSYLRENPTLLIADNFEQVLSAATELKALSDYAPALKILVTSRVLLQLSSEFEFRVSTLEVPEISGEVSLDALSRNDSISLFVDRAKAVSSTFELTQENAEEVAEICRSLDGLPLAIELAAARIKIVTPKAILDRLENRLGLLTGGAKDLPARQQTVRATVEWSYELLTEEDQTLFRRLAVFVGGFTIEAAENVAAQPGQSLLDGITSLVNSSLIVKKVGINNEPRFRLLEVIREFAVEALESSGELDALQRIHAAYFQRLGEEAQPHFQLARAVEWLDRFEVEHDNVRAALQWSLAEDPEIATRLSAAIPMFWILRGHLSEGQQWLRAALALEPRTTPTSIRCKQLMGLGVLEKFQGNYREATRLFEEALKLGKGTNDQVQIAWSCRQLANVAIDERGDFLQARDLLQESLKINRKLNDESGLAYCLYSFANLMQLEGELSKGRLYFEEALALFRNLENQAMISTGLCDLGTISYLEGDYQSASSYFTESLLMSRRIGFKSTLYYSVEGFAALATKHGNVERAAQLAGAISSLRDSIGLEMPEADRRFHNSYLVDLRAAFPDPGFSSAFEQGRKLNLDDAVNLALNLGAI